MREEEQKNLLRAEEMEALSTREETNVLGSLLLDDMEKSGTFVDKLSSFQRGNGS